MEKRTKTKVVLVQLGSPKSSRTRDVRDYLKEFLGDPRVVDINPLLWKLILNLFVLPFRPARSARLYRRIETPEGFPLITITARFAEKLKAYLPPHIEVNHCFLLSSPRVLDVFREWEGEDEWERAQRVLVLPQFPQYAESTIASGIDGFAATVKKIVNIPSFEFINHYHRSRVFIDHSVARIRKTLGERSFDHLVLSFHGIPTRRVLLKKDLYYRHCFETFYLLRQQLREEIEVSFCFQSRFGSEEWLRPYTDDHIQGLIGRGKTQLAVYCPSFVVDCLETIDEIGHELLEDARRWGGEVSLIPCLNDDEGWAQDYAQFIQTHIDGDSGAKRELYYQVSKEVIKKEMPMPTMESEPLSAEAKGALKLMFLVLFIDIMGFSIIFPLFPALAQYYLEFDGENVFLRGIFSLVESLMNVSGQQASSIVLFGGILGALYSFLQFLFAPLWGGLSDRIGRRPVLLLSLFGLAASYGLWFFGASFTVLILGRFLGGVMAGNISTASAVVADVTSSKNRGKGMAIIGVALALGFIVGPAIGGLLSLWRIDQLLEWPGVNPFSAAALFAAAITLINFILVLQKFKETLPTNTRLGNRAERSNNPVKLFRPLPFAGVNLTNYSNFFFLTAFSGMEFTLTFLAVERLNYTPLDNGILFIYIGVLIALVQGGYVRRKIAQVGETRMATQGLYSLVPGLLLIAFADTSLLLYAGLFFLAVGSSMVIPSLTSLASQLAPADQQGLVLGVFRSLGALARVVGPLLAALIYWRFGSAWPYTLGAASLLIPLWLLHRLKGARCQMV